MAAQFDFKKRLGAGHFGEVWLVTDTGLNATRALKLIPPNKIPDPNNFFREAQILKSAEHPNIVHVEETGTLADGRVYVAMEYLKNGSLEDEASGSYIPLTRAKKLMIDMLRGLEHAHVKGIIHRDIKPANILIGNACEGKLSDFGLALSSIKDARNGGIRKYDYTPHIAPEVYNGKDHSVVSDVYASGVTLYRIVNGDSYLPTTPTDEVPDEAAKGLYPNREKYRAFIPRPLRMVINKAMSVNPSDRYTSARELRSALERAILTIDWNESTFSDRTVWSAARNGHTYELELYESTNGHSQVTAKKGPNAAKLRRMGSLCSAHSSRESGWKTAGKVLQHFVLGKLN